MSDPRLRMPNLNNLIIGGRLVRSPEMRITSGGMNYTKGTLVAEESFKRGDQWEKKSTFLDFTIWGVGAEKVSNMLKGDAIIAEGRLQQEEWDDKQTGQKRTKISMNAHRVQPLSWPPKNEDPPPQTQDESGGDAPDDDGIPF